MCRATFLISALFVVWMSSPVRAQGPDAPLALPMGPVDAKAIDSLTQGQRLRLVQHLVEAREKSLDNLAFKASLVVTNTDISTGKRKVVMRTGDEYRQLGAIRWLRQVDLENDQPDKVKGVRVDSWDGRSPHWWRCVCEGSGLATNTFRMPDRCPECGVLPAGARTPNERVLAQLSS